MIEIKLSEKAIYLYGTKKDPLYVLIKDINIKTWLSLTHALPRWNLQPNIQFNSFQSDLVTGRIIDAVKLNPVENWQFNIDIEEISLQPHQPPLGGIITT